MKRPVVGFDAARDHGLRLCKSVDSFGYTLVEILVATVLSLILMGAVVRMFGDVGESITDSRSMLESADRLRVAEARLQLDLAGITATPNPPRKPENNEGYFEYIEGPIAQATAPTYARNSDSSTADTTVGDFDDILMFTTRSKSRPFVGKYGLTAIQSDVAEVAWFLRGHTLHRRVLLVAPSATIPASTSYYQNYDISARIESGAIVFNTLGDLTRRECRFAHTSAVPLATSNGWYWTWTNSGGTAPFYPTLPTLNECSYCTTTLLPSLSTAKLSGVLDFWVNNPTYWTSNTSDRNRIADNAFIPQTSPTVPAIGVRASDDIILTNVIGFDVKGWDPMYGGYVDLGYNGTLYDLSTAAGAQAALGLGHLGNPSSKLNGSTSTARVYDTYSTSYESADASDGFDNGSGTAGIIDDDGEKGVAPPYPIPLRGIQVKIRTFEPDSKQVREVTVVQDFLPQ